MKLWAAATVGLYALILLVLTTPLLLIFYGEWWGAQGGGLNLKDALTVYKEAGYWIWLGILVVAQAFMLLAPAGSRERLTPRRSLFVPILTTGFLLANLILCGLVCIACVCFSDKGLMVFAVIGDFVANDAAHMWGFLFGQGGVITSPNVQFAFGVVTATAVFWLFWAFVFYWFAKSDDPDSLIKRSTRWLLRGSVAELLVAVPSHIIVRHRHDCCAPVGTLFGIGTGLAILLIAFGPGVFFLFVERAQQLRPRQPAH